MIMPWCLGSALNLASCQSPTDSKTKPPSHAAAPMIVIGPAGARSSMPAWIGRVATHKIRAWSR